MSGRLKIMLVTPPYHSGVVESAGVWMNVALVHLAGSLRARGHEVEIYDAMSMFIGHDEIKKHIDNRRPDLVALTAITACFPDAAQVCVNTKEIGPDIITVMGNVHPSFMWQETLNNEGKAIDYVVRGEGEETFAELADAIAEGADPASVNGIAFMRDKKPYATPPRAHIQDLDALPRSWNLIDWSIYTYRPRPGSTLAVVSSSRGCEQQCMFCSQQLFWNKSWRGRSAQSFIDELEMLKREYGVDVAMISDETPTMDRRRWEKILDLLIERKIGIELLMETRVEDILRDENILCKYREAGVSHIYVGVEATDQATLDVFKKDINIEQSRKAIELINRHDIVSETSFLLGMPDESPEHIKTTIELAKHYNPDLAFFLAITPWPYSEIYSLLEPFIETRDYKRYNLVEPVIKPKNMTIGEVARALSEASIDFYLNKFRHLEELSKEKQIFMLRVARLLMEHSYLAGDMRSMEAEMPNWIKKKLDEIKI